MIARVLALLLALTPIACRTEITFKNDVPGATIENPRWVTDDGEVYAPESDDRLEPGQSSDPVLIVEPHEGSTGRVHFELVVEGRNVALVTDRRFTADTNSNTTFTLTPSTVATNPLVSSATQGLASGDEER